MDGAQFNDIMQKVANDLLVWVGFGTLVGLLAKAIMPGRDPGGAVATLMMGIGGSVIGCGTLMFFWEGQRVTPISPVGFLVATGGAFMVGVMRMSYLSNSRCIARNNTLRRSLARCHSAAE